MCIVRLLGLPIPIALTTTATTNARVQNVRAVPDAERADYCDRGERCVDGYRNERYFRAPSRVREEDEEQIEDQQNSDVGEPN